MRRPLGIVALSSLVALAAAACGSSPEVSSPGTVTSGSGALSVGANTITSFDGTYTANGAWARARVAYTPSTTMYEITTSHGTVVVRTGTALDVRSEPSQQDPRAVDGVVQVAATDPEHTVLAGLLDALLAAGASATPSRVGQGSTLYAAAFYTAKSLGMVSSSGKTDVLSMPTIWPYPGYTNKADMPSELVGVEGLQNGSGSITCCGPYTCVDFDWNPGIGCDDWCAAGDGCNVRGWGHCGTAMFWPSGGCNSCPHSDSSYIKSHSYHGCNNGTCNVRCWESTPTHYGPASNFDYYGNHYYGSGGGEYGSGPNDHW
jgi:hypothetical protein